MALPAPTRSRPAAGPDPLRELEQLTERLTDLWEAGLGASLGHWVPLADLEETDDSWSVEIELPGAGHDDVDVQLDDRVLTVSGEIHEKKRTGILHRRTRRVGRFHYAVTLPGEVDAEGVDAQLRDGVLTVRVPKAAHLKRRRIEITG
jgi:HSP20 family protein